MSDNDFEQNPVLQYLKKTDGLFSLTQERVLYTLANILIWYLGFVIIHVIYDYIGLIGFFIFGTLYLYFVVQAIRGTFSWFISNQKMIDWFLAQMIAEKIRKQQNHPSRHK